MKRILLLMLTLLGLCLEVQAQKGLAIQSAFDELAVRQNATEVVMGAGKLKKYRLRLFHSLEMKSPSPAERSRIETLVQTDAAPATQGDALLHLLPLHRTIPYPYIYRGESQPETD